MEKAKDRTELLEKYQNKWLALTDDDKIISSGSTLDAVLREAKTKGFVNPVTTRIPDFRFEFIL